MKTRKKAHLFLRIPTGGAADGYSGGSMSDGMGGGIIAFPEWLIIRVAAPSIPGCSSVAIMRCSHISPGSASHPMLYCLVVVGRLRLPYRPAVVG